MLRVILFFQWKINKGGTFFTQLFLSELKFWHQTQSRNFKLLMFPTSIIHNSEGMIGALQDILSLFDYTFSMRNGHSWYVYNTTPYWKEGVFISSK